VSPWINVPREALTLKPESKAKLWTLEEGVFTVYELESHSSNIHKIKRGVIRRRLANGDKTLASVLRPNGWKPKL
jgi:hypothetical protein